MKAFGIILAALLASSATARVVTADKAPYARTLTKRSENFNEEIITLGPESAIHKRVTKHIRPDYSHAWNKRRAPAASRGTGIKRAAAAAADDGSITDFGSGDPQPQRGDKGASFLHESNTAIDKQNIDYLSPPPTDAGVIPNLKWSFSLSKTRLLKGGWVREQVVTDLPISKDVAAAEQRLSPYAYRELHWHRVAEWGLVLNGSVRITGNDEDGGNYVADIPTGDLWSFPRGVPHSLQAGPDGAQYLLVFDDGNFDAQGTTFMVDDWLSHTPKDVLAENFGLNASVFTNVTSPDPYMVAADSWPSLEDAQQAVSSNPQGQTKAPFHYELSKQDATQAPGGGGWVKITDVRQFPASSTLASALVHVEPNAIRELHWHKNTEWGYIISGHGRATAFAGGATARTFELQAGDSWVFPTNYGHYIQNIGNEPLVFVEIFRGSNFGDEVKFDDFSLQQWLALNPPELVARNLNVSISVVQQLKKEKQILVAAQNRK
ncbi:hypothetical protein OC842_004186 [Tilletia horrida]|uniref:Cupin type-1 domain-containing protein n=1 Tax=Tilletia horrida TaxID=155126 RepID=A0AAN6GEV3_9BASI|nr:hypothetical protein OC842_004186 [Tilletia horrida]